MLYRQIQTLVILILAAFMIVAGIAGDKPGKPEAIRNDSPAVQPGENAEQPQANARTKGGKSRDPFFNPTRYIAQPKAAKIKIEPKPVPAPGFENRLNAYKDQLKQYLGGTAKEPSKTSPYLVEELAVTGIFRTDDGIGAFLVENATKNQQTFFARAGWQTNDGVIKDVLPNGVRFIKTVHFDNGTVKQIEEFRALPAYNSK